MNRRKNIEVLLSYLLYFSGILFLVRIINKKLNRIAIITYHSISEDYEADEYRSCLDLMGMNVPKSQFIQHIKYIYKNYNVINLDELVNFYNTNKKLPTNPIVITFDDGFKNNYITAYPVLKKYNCKATFFIIGNSQVADGIVWLHLLYRVLDTLSGKKFNVTIDDLINFKIDKFDDESKINVAHQLKKVLGRLPFEKKINTLQIICMQNKIDFNQIKNSDIYMTTDEIKDVCHSGNLLGSHSMSHDNLTFLPVSLQKEEIFQSKKIIQKICNNYFIPFSYPYGTKNSFDNEIKTSLKKNLFSCGVTTIEGLNGKNTDLYELKRIEIGNFKKIEFIVHMSGFIGDIKIMLKKLIKSE